MTKMEGTKPLARIVCILAIAIGEMLTSAYMIQETNIYADSNDQTDARSDLVAILTKRLDELEQARVKDVQELDLRIKELSELRENDARALTKLNNEVEEQKRLRVKDLHLTTVLTSRLDELEHQCGNGKHSENYISMETQTPPHKETPYNNLTDAPSNDTAASTLNDTMTNKGDLSTHSDYTQNSDMIRGQGRIQSRQSGRISRVSPSDDTVAFHAIVAHTILNPTTTHVIVFDKLVTNSGAAHYSSNSGIFTATQSGVYVFSWAIGVPGNQYMYTELVRNNAVIGSSLTGEDAFFSAASATAAVHLEVGDEVWVRVGGHSGGPAIHGARSMFTGFRVR